MKNNLSIIGGAAGSVMAILTLIGFLAEPFLEDYVNARIELHEAEVEAENSAKVGLRTLLGQKMGVADDEVHIELGHQYRNEGETIEALEYQKRFNAAVVKEFNYYHPNNLLKNLITSKFALPFSAGAEIATLTAFLASS